MEQRQHSFAHFLNNPLLDTDSYKGSHFLQYPEGAEAMFSYIEPRGYASWIKDIAQASDLKEEVVFFGLETILREYLEQPITAEMVEYAAEFFAEHGVSFPRDQFMKIVNELDGKLPVSVFAIPEGTVVPVKTGVMYVQVFGRDYFWLTQYIETLMLRVWYPSTVATLSRMAKQIIAKAMEKSCDNLDGLPFKLHDFGSRGVSSAQSAALGGMAHLVNFMGSDTVLGVLAARHYYGEKMAGYSIDATEHSTICSWTQAGEKDAYKNAIKRFGDKAIFACVSDAYDIEHAVADIWGGELIDEVKKMNATLVIRPDSGDPIIWLPKLLNILADKFGYEVNSKGYKVLNKVRLIQGDGVTLETLPLMLNAVMDAGFSIDNVAFGMGGGLLQKVDRDTFKWAMKCSAININGDWVDVFKDPITDPGKVSKKGVLATVRNLDGNIKTVTVDEVTEEDMIIDSCIWSTDRIFDAPDFSAVRDNASI